MMKFNAIEIALFMDKVGQTYSEWKILIWKFKTLTLQVM